MNTDKIYAEKIASEYAPKEAGKIVALKKLDALAKRGAHIFAYTFGTASALVFGTGMCFCMEVLPVTGALAMLLGLILGVIGTALMIIAYPIYKKITEARKNKLAPEIIKLSNEILGQK